MSKRPDILAGIESNRVMWILLVLALLALACSQPIPSGPPTHSPYESIQSTWATSMLSESTDLESELLDLYQKVQRVAEGYETEEVGSLSELVDFASAIRFTDGACYVFEDDSALAYAEVFGLTNHLQTVDMVGIGQTTDTSSLISALACYPTYTISVVKNERAGEDGTLDVIQTLTITDQTNQAAAVLYYSGATGSMSFKLGDRELPLDKITFLRQLETGQNVTEALQTIAAENQAADTE